MPQWPFYLHTHNSSTWQWSVRPQLKVSVNWSSYKSLILNSNFNTCHCLHHVLPPFTIIPTLDTPSAARPHKFKAAMQFSSQLNMKHYSLASRVSSSAVTLPAGHPAVQLSNIFSAASNPKAISLSYQVIFSIRDLKILFFSNMWKSLPMQWLYFKLFLIEINLY